jgi:hypothetical protein
MFSNYNTLTVDYSKLQKITTKCQEKGMVFSIFILQTGLQKDLL